MISDFHLALVLISILSGTALIGGIAGFNIANILGTRYRGEHEKR